MSSSHCLARDSRVMKEIVSPQSRGHRINFNPGIETLVVEIFECSRDWGDAGGTQYKFHRWNRDSGIETLPIMFYSIMLCYIMVCYTMYVTLYVIVYYVSMSVLLYSVTACSVLLYSLLFCSVLYCSALFSYVLLYSWVSRPTFSNSEKYVNADVSRSVSAPSDRPDDCKGSRDVVFQCPELTFVARSFVPPLVRTHR